MKVTVRKDKVIIDGYVNAVDRFSRPLFETQIGRFVEKILPNVFAAAIKRAKNIDVLLNHDDSRLLASTADGTAKLVEDNVGLRATVEITDPEVIQNARDGKLRGWSFGFSDPTDQRTPTSNGIVERIISALTLHEVSIINDKALPAYIGTSIEARAIADTTVEVRGLDHDTEIETTDETETSADGGEETTRTTDEVTNPTDEPNADDVAEDEATTALIEEQRLKRAADLRRISI